MAKHVLSLEAPDTMNDCILRVVDTSVYNTDIDIICPLLEVTLPGFSYPVQFDESEIQPGFMLNLTACDLEVQTESCGTVFNPLPDGIYILKYSVSPKEYVFAEYNHLRMTKALTQWQEALCDLDLAACDPPKKVKDKLHQLQDIKSYLDAAKAKVETCHEPKKGMELYNYAVKLLNKFDCKSC